MREIILLLSRPRLSLALQSNSVNHNKYRAKDWAKFGAKSRLNSGLRHTVLSLLFLMIAGTAHTSYAQSASILVDTAVLPAISTPTATTLSPFTRITFSTPFAPGTVPNVFPMTPEFGAGAADDPCVMRIRNIDNLGFDAACLEPFNEDRDAPSVSFNYIAIQNGSTSVPLVGGGSVQFQSRCNFVNNQVFGPRCTNCALATGQTQSFQNISFSPAFSSPPALLTQIASTNNTLAGSATIPGGEPETLVAAVGNGSLSAAGYSVSLDRMEAGNGVINNGENICHLAVERGGCQELDLSSLGGPASVLFNATFGDNVDGHDNGASSGEGATFAPNCFSSTPVVLGGHRSRRGNNGGFLRLVSQNATEAIFTFDEDRVSDTERNHIDEEISVLAFSSTFTTPVTLSKARVQQVGRKTTFNWETSAEIFHLGFHLWGETESGWEQLNKRLVPGQPRDTALLSEYSHTVRLNRQQYNTIRRFGISSVDNTGYEEFYGPFETGVDYGEASNSEPVNWAKTRQNFEQRMRRKGYSKVGNRWRRVSQQRKLRLEKRELGIDQTVLTLNFEANGIHQISAEEVLAVVPHWQNLALDRLAVMLNGDAVARHVVSDDDFFNAGDALIFNVRKPIGKDATYLKQYAYQLRINRASAIDASLFNADVDASTALSEHALVSVTPTEDKAYSAVLNADRPWFDARIVSYGNPSSVNYAVDFERDVDTTREAYLEVSLVGGLDFPEPQDDHHIQIKVNGQLVDDALFDGLIAYNRHIKIPANLVKQTGNQISITVPGDTGLAADIVMVDKLVLSAYSALRGHDTYYFPADVESPGYQVYVGANAPQNAPAVFAFTDSGLLSKLDANTDQASGTLRFAALPSLKASRGTTQYAVSATNTWPSASAINVADGSLLHTTQTDLLIVAHPNFIGPELDDYVAFKLEQGYQPKIVNWLDLVETYGFGNNTPSALINFLARSREYYDTQNVLLVGGHTYDYLGFLNEEIVNFIPTNYRRVNFYEFAPTDNVFADLTGNGLPDFAIGRWPVRSIEDLRAIVQKNKDWQANRDANSYQSAVLIAQPNDARNLDFDKQMNTYLNAPLQQINGIDTVHKIVMQDIADSALETPVQQVRSRINDYLNDGLSLLSFSGHGSYSSWGFQGVVDTNFVKSLENVGKPTLVMPLACYTTNYEHPSVNTLAHQWLFSGEQGAVAIQGASLLGDYRENGIFAERYLRQTSTSATVGEAIMKAKNEMAKGNDMLDNWAYLGDPTLPLR